MSIGDSGDLMLITALSAEKHDRSGEATNHETPGGLRGGYTADGRRGNASAGAVALAGVKVSFI